MDVCPWNGTSYSASIVVAALASAGSGVPLTVAGALNVGVVVREDGMLAGASLGEGFVTGRGDGVLGPFEGQVTFRAPAKAGGAVLLVDRSAADGSVMGATVVRVTF